MKFIDINREFTAAANSYMAQGYYINAGTMGGSQGEVAHTFPRMRGGDPCPELKNLYMGDFSPHARG